MVRFAFIGLVVAFVAQAVQASGPCLSFDGSTGTVTVDNSAGLNLNGPFTVEAWVDPVTANQKGDIFYKWFGGIGANERTIYLQLDDGHLVFVESTDGTQAGEVGVTSTDTLPAGQWVNIAAVHTANQMSIYVNGVEDATVATTNAFPFLSTSPVLIGGTPDLNFEEFQGDISDVRVSSVARYTSNFTPSTTEFSDDANTLMLLPFDEGTGTSTANLGSVGGAGELAGGVTWATGSPVSVPEPAALSSLVFVGLLFRRRVPR